MYVKYAIARTGYYDTEIAKHQLDDQFVCTIDSIEYAFFFRTAHL